MAESVEERLELLESEVKKLREAVEHLVVALDLLDARMGEFETT